MSDYRVKRLTNDEYWIAYPNGGKSQVRVYRGSGDITDGLLARSLKVFNHSPDGFEFGYAGSGPAQLALALLLAAGASPKRAVEAHQEFKRRFISDKKCEEFLLTGEEIRRYLQG